MAGKGVANVIHLPFVGPRIKELIWNNGAPRAPTVLFQFQSLFGAAHRIKVVPCIKHIASTEPVSGAVNLVRPRFQPYAGDRSGLPAEFRFGIDLCIEFLNGVDGNELSRVPKDGSGVRYAKSHKRFVIRDAVYDEAGVFRTNAVGSLRPRTPTGIDRSAGAQREQVLVIAAIQRQIVDNFVANGAAQSGGR